MFYRKVNKTCKTGIHSEEHVLPVLSCSLEVHVSFQPLGEGAWPPVTGWLWGQAGTVTPQNDSLESPSALSSTHRRLLSLPACPAMGTSLLCCVTFCLLQAGESREGSLSGSRHQACPLRLQHQLLLLHRSRECWCHSGPKILGPEDRTEHDPEMCPGSGPQLYVLVPTRPGTRAEADPLFNYHWHHQQRRCPQRVQRLQIKPRELPSHAGGCHPLPDICVPLRQQLLHSTARPPPLCTKRQGRPCTPGLSRAPCRLLAPGALEPWVPGACSVTLSVWSRPAQT